MESEMLVIGIWTLVGLQVVGTLALVVASMRGRRRGRLNRSSRREHPRWHATTVPGGELAEFVSGHDVSEVPLLVEGTDPAMFFVNWREREGDSDES